jgi:coenzyme F420-reducing hydrogenase alpha subunit
MKIDLDVNVHHLTRVEGHGNILVKVRDGKVREARWDVVETPRFFEAMLKGKHYTSAGMLTARICGICSIGHCLATLRATEQAFGVTIPATAAKLRLLAKHGETLQSHWLHLFFLAAPDFVGLPSVLPLLETHPEIVHLARRLKGTANRLCEAVAGRSVHPVSLQPGGVTAVPSREKLSSLRDELHRSLEDVAAACQLFRSFTLPQFERETEFVSLKGENEYPWIGGSMISTDGVEHGESDYLKMTNEYVDAHNTSKWCRLSRPSFAVGALARCNNNFRLLHPEAARVAQEFGLPPLCHNPFMNNIAQLVECMHLTHEAIRLIDELSREGGAETMAGVTPRAGVGVGAVEVPRGILYHFYEYDREGYVVRANCIIPTTQNNANIHLDLPSLAEKFAGDATMTDAKLELLCSMLVRAYDPCISCSVH